MNDTVFTLDCEQRYTEIFGKWMGKSGLLPQLFIGKTVRDVFEPQLAEVHAGATPTWQVAMPARVFILRHALGGIQKSSTREPSRRSI